MKNNTTTSSDNAKKILFATAVICYIATENVSNKNINTQLRGVGFLATALLGLLAIQSLDLNFGPYGLFGDGKHCGNREGHKKGLGPRKS